MNPLKIVIGFEGIQGLRTSSRATPLIQGLRTSSRAAYLIQAPLIKAPSPLFKLCVSVIVIDTSVDGLFLNNNECDEYNMNISHMVCCKNDKNDGGMYCMIVRRI